MSADVSELPALLEALTSRPTQLSTAGYPYLDRAGWVTLRDRVPILFGMGQRVLDLVEPEPVPRPGSRAARDEAIVRPPSVPAASCAARATRA